MPEKEASLNRQKQQTLRRLFDDDWMLVHVDTRVARVKAPEHLSHNPSVTFKLSRQFHGATEIAEDHLTADLLFGSSRFLCFIPFAAIWGVTAHRGSNIIWPESTPPEVLAEINKKSDAAKPPEDEEKPAAGKRPQLRRVK